MKKISLVFIFALIMILGGCGNAADDESPMFDSIVIFGNADDVVATYYVNSKFDRSGDYTLELSVSIPNENGTSNLEVLNSKEFKVNEGNELLVDGILIKEVENKVKEKTRINFKDLEYQVGIYRGEKDNKGNGVTSKWKLFESKKN